MSCFESLTKSIDREVTSLLKNISSKYNIDEKEILEMWTSKNTVAPQVSNTSNTPEENALMKLSKSELIEMCKGKALKVTGTKNDLVNRISECDKKKSAFFQSKDKIATTNNVVNKLVEKIPIIEIKKNKFGNYEHHESSLVYDNKTQKMYGKQNSDGSISKLTKDDIDTCNKYKFSYNIPDNLADNKEDDEEDVEFEEDVEEEDDEVEFEEEDDEEEEEEEEIEEEIEDCYD